MPCRRFKGGLRLRALFTQALRIDPNLNPL
ncbi:Uncharacterised protein [Vibrio cholerae]|nr:Uncharacterised protein [Vibrio cholerae]